MVRAVLDGGERTGWAARAITEGGWWARPTPVAPGLALVGDSAGLVNVPTLKGLHYAIASGMLAADAIAAAVLRGSGDLGAYATALDRSSIAAELHRSRNMKQVFGKGFFAGGVLANLMELSGGRIPGGRWPNHPDAETPMRIGRMRERYPRPDGTLTFDKLSSVYLSGNATRDDAPGHIRIRRRVPREVAETWAWMCPAGVYEIPDDAPQTGDVEVIVNASNCVQCGAITAKGGRLTPPEGGDGPLYGDM
jgi:electron-transferring-flavoprotein dehydrogenase